MSIEDQIVQMASYELTDNAETFTKAITALSTRTQAEGPRGISRYSFYVNAGARNAGSNVVMTTRNRLNFGRDALSEYDQLI